MKTQPAEAQLGEGQQREPAPGPQLGELQDSLIGAASQDGPSGLSRCVEGSGTPWDVLWQTPMESTGPLLMPSPIGPFPKPDPRRDSLPLLLFRPQEHTVWVDA